MPLVEVLSLPGIHIRDRSEYNTKFETGSSALHEWNIVGRPVELMADISLAKCWIDECVQTHEDCSQPRHTRLPSRVLDLRPPKDTLDLRLLASDGRHGRYATLSHCWGTSQPLKLTSATFNEFQNKISYLSLPKTFQDAVAATRLLGLRYLWIDSLCIKQDSKADWEEQCSKMAQVYKDSYVTLAGPAASSCNSGFLDTRPTPVQAWLEISDGKKSDKIVLSHPGVIQEFWRLGPEPNSPWSKRGWILQERLLSHRVLYFGSNIMYFECLTNLRFENCYYPTTWNYGEIGIVEKVAIGQLITHSECLKYWTKLVSTYSEMFLTRPTDKLPALSGLASELQRITKDRYLAGMWQEGICSQLAWMVPAWVWGKPHITLSSDYTAPSWSWAAAKHQVNIGSQDIIRSESGFEILNSWVALTGLDPFGQVKDGYIEVRGKLQSFVVRKLPHEPPTGLHSLYVQSGDAQSPRLAMYNPDIASIIPESGFNVLLLYLGEYSNGNVAALGIEPIDSHYNIRGLDWLVLILIVGTAD
ncbi:HET domain containing protein [Hyaloscypha variabilis]